VPIPPGWYQVGTRSPGIRTRVSILSFGVSLRALSAALAQVSVLVPEKKEAEKATTNDKGLTATFDAKGRYGVVVRMVEAKPGEWKGEKYDEVSTVATLVVDVK